MGLLLLENDMAINDYVFDNGLQAMVDDCDELVLCSQDPGLTYADANATYRLGSINPNLSLVNGTTDGRAVQMGTQTGGSITATDGTGTNQVWAFIDTSASRVLATCPVSNDQPVTSGNTFSIGTAFQAVVFRDPTS